jgi:hypothetical protein
MGWTMLYLFVFLKIPILVLFYIVWWAVKQDTNPTNDGGDGGSRLEAKPLPHPHPKLPRTPRRGPHGDPLPLPPPRVRPVAAPARQPQSQ